MVKENSKLADYNEVPVIEHFYSHLNMEDITDVDYTVYKKVLQRFQNKQFRRISWFLCSKWYIVVSRCIWELLRQVSWNVCT